MADRGYTYTVSDEQLRVFLALSPARRLQWLEETRELMYRLATPEVRASWRKLRGVGAGAGADDTAARRAVLAFRFIADRNELGGRGRIANVVDRVNLGVLQLAVLVVIGALVNRGATVCAVFSGGLWARHHEIGDRRARCREQYNRKCAHHSASILLRRAWPRG